MYMYMYMYMYVYMCIYIYIYVDLHIKCSIDTYNLCYPTRRPDLAAAAIATRRTASYNKY